MSFRTNSKSALGARVKGVAAAGLLAGVLAIPPSAASAHGYGGLPDAEILATDNTAVITDPADPRLDRQG